MDAPGGYGFMRLSKHQATQLVLLMNRGESDKRVKSCTADVITVDNTLYSQSTWRISAENMCFQVVSVA